MHWTIKNKILLGFGLNWLALVLVGTVGYFTSTNLLAYVNQAQHTQIIRDDFNDLMTALVNAEADQRGYIIAGDETLLETYDLSLLQIEAQVQDLRDEETRFLPHTTFNAPQLDTLEELIAQRVTLYNNAIQVRRTSGFEAAQALIGTPEGETILAHIGTLLNDLEQAETNALNEQTTQVQKNVNYAIYVIAIGTLLALSAAVLGGIGITNRISHSIAVLETGVKHLATGDLDYRVPITSHDEIAELTKAFNQMMDRLQVAQTEKSASDSLFQSLFEASPDALLVVNGQRMITLANLHAETLLEYPPHTLQGVSIEALLPERYRVLHMDHFTRYMTSPKNRPMGTEMEFYIQTRTGHEIPVNILLNTLPHEENPLVLCVVMDVTEQIQARQALEKANEELEQRVEARTAELARSEKDFRALADNALVGVYRATVEGVLLYANETLARMYGFSSPEEMNQLSVLDRYNNPLDRTQLIHRLRENGRVRNVELEMLTLQEEVITVLASMTLDGNILSGMLIDITERTWIQKEVEWIARFPIENPNPILRITRAGEIVYNNPSSKTLLETWKRKPREIVPDDWQVLIQTALSSGEKKTVEILLQDRFFSILIVPVVDLNYVNLYGMDITERKQAEKALFEIAENMAAAQRIGHFGSWEIGLTPDRAFMNPQLWSDECYRIIGVEPRSIENTPDFFYRLVHPEDREFVTQTLQNTIREGTGASYEYRLVRPDGNIRYIQDQIKLGLDEQTGRPTKVTGMVRDITEQKQAEEALRLSESRYRTLFEDVPVAIWEEDFSDLKRHLDALQAQGITDFRTYFADHPDELVSCASLIKVLDVNNAALKMYQAGTKEDLRKNTLQTLSLGEQAHNLEDFLAIAEGETSHCWEGADKTLTGEPIEISLSWSVAPGHEADYSKVIVTTVDITQSKRAEKAVQASEQRLQLALNATNMGVWEWELATNAVYWSPECYVITGIQEFDETFESFRHLFHPEDANQVMATFQKAIDEKNVFFQEFRIIRPDGEVLWISTFGLIHYNEADQPFGMIGTVQDISKRKQIELALVEEKERLDKIAATVPGLLSSFRIAADGTPSVVYASPMIQEVYGLALEVVSQDASLYTNNIHPQDVPKVMEGLYTSALTLQPWHSEYRYQHPTKGEIWLEGHSMPVREPDGSTLWHGFVHDITERKLTAKALQGKDELLRLTGEMSRVGGWEFDTDTLKGTWTDEVARIHDLDPAAETNVALGLSFYAGEMRAKIEKAIQEAIELKKPYDLELTLITAKGNPKWIRTMGMPILEGDLVVKLRGIYQDITERKHAEAQLQAHTHRISLLAEASRTFAEASLNYGTLLENIIQHLAKALGDMCGIHLLARDDNWEAMLAVHDVDANALTYTQTILSTMNFGKELTVFSQQVIDSGQTLFIDRLNIEQFRSSLHTEFRLLLEPIGIHSLIVAPLNFNHYVMGLLYFVRHQPDLPTYTESDRTLAIDLADRAALAITNARLFALVERELFKKAQAEEEVRLLNAELEQRVTLRTEELRAALKKMETLYTLARAAVESENPQEALQGVVHRVATTLPAHHAILLTFDLSQKKVIYLVPGGPGVAKYSSDLTFEDWMDGLAGWVMREGKATLSPKGQPDPRESAAVQQRRVKNQTGSVAVAPLRFLDQTLGTITVINHPDERDFSEADLELLEAVANQAAALLVRASLYESLQNTNLGLQAEIADRKLLEIQIRQNEARAQALADMSQALEEARLDRQRLFEMIAVRVSELIGDSCHLSLISKDRKWLETMTFYHPDPVGLTRIQGFMGEALVPIGQGLAGKVAQTGEPILVPMMLPEENRPQIASEFQPDLDRFGIASALIVPIRTQNQIIGTMGIFRDQPGRPYTQDDQFFLQALAYRAGLAIENSRLFIEAMAAREEADRANVAKSEFLSRMSHELRTPLNAILGFAQILNMDELNKPQTTAIQHILKAGKHLLELINEVLDITRIEVGKFSISSEPVRIKDVIEAAVELVESLAAQKNIQIEKSSLLEEYVKADHQRLKQVLINLLINAIKYNREGGQVFVDCLPLPGDKLQIRIRDTGPGISPERQKRLFIPFERLGAERTTVEGTGLGLALSRSLVQAMGGSLELESEVGVGTTFWIELAIVESPMEQSYHPEDGIVLIPFNEQTRTHTVLCFEDNISNLQLIEQIFKHRPFIRLIAAVEGKTGLEVAYEQTPDVILLDLNLPDMNGYDVIHRLKANPITRAIPVIVVSADATPGQIQRLLDVGAHAYITKPLDVVKFLQVIDNILDK